MTGPIAQTSERIYPEQVAHSPEAYLEYLRHLFAYEWAKTMLTPEHRVLEIGCGDGYGTAYLASWVQQIIGVDIQPDVIEQAREKYGALGCDFQMYDGTTLPWASGTFDRVLSFQVIEHIHDVSSYLLDIQRVLKPDGCVLLTTPNAVHRLQPGQRPWNRFHLREYRPEELRQSLEKIFSEVRVSGICGTEEIQALEHARIRRIRKMVAYDLFSLRQRLPVSWEKRGATWLQRVLKGRKNTLGNPEEIFAQYSLKDFRLCDTEVDESLDLVAVCWV